MESHEVLKIGENIIEPGEQRDITVTVSESYSGLPVLLPVTVWRAAEPGPVVLVTAAVHGDELNGIGIVRSIILDSPFELSAGTLLLVPVINMLGFDRHQRYLPDRRDLNRAFPGMAGGSLASRFAHAIFRHLVAPSNYIIDLHTAAVRRTNFPNIRADLTNPEVARIANAFGCELVVNGRGPKGSLRRASCKAGHPTIILEAGEVWKIEPSVVEVGVRGIRNVLIELEMVQGKTKKPPYQVHIDETKWLRADAGGILQFHVAPGEVIEKDQPIATNSDLHGKQQNVLRSPAEAVVLGMSTLPSVTPGDPVCHLAIPRDGIAEIRAAVEALSGKSLHERVRDDLSTNVAVTDGPQPA
ncbi:MAG: succinylglutamate desuccinylase/aspartoacylase family protein [Phycisphaerales bacterium]|nr:succinylglutamate desuccinylase/aspartoacylase family protein [Phycisphaerales bacterium]